MFDKKDKTKTKQVSVRLTLEVIKQLKEMAIRDNRDLSKQIGHYIEVGLRENK